MFICDGKRYDEKKMEVLYDGHREIGTGIYLEKVLQAKRSKRVFIFTYSCWDAGNGESVGDLVREADADDIVWLVETVGIDELMELVPEGDA